jgi:hypothetical protein
MAADKAQTKQIEGNARAFLDKATPEQLLEIAGGTALSADPIVKNYRNGGTPELLRKRIAREWKHHADFRGMVIRAVARMQPAAPAEKKGGSEGGRPAKGKKEGKAPPPAPKEG